MSQTSRRERQSELEAMLLARNAFVVTMLGSVLFLGAIAFTMFG